MPSYTEVSISGYNAATAPSDDGTVTATNKIQWSIIKAKLSDPLNTAVGSINTNLVTAFTTIDANIATAETNLATVQAAYDAAVAVLDAPTSTAALFLQTSAPTGWTKGATHNDKMLRLITGTVSTGGTTAFSSVFTAKTLATANLPSHGHSWNSGAVSITFNDTSLVTGVSKDGNSNVDNSGGQSPVNDVSEDTEALSATGSVSGTTGTAGQTTPTAMDFALRYVDTIIATKDA